MTMKVRGLVVLAVMAATMWLVGCGHYVCKTGLGATTCSSSGTGGISQGGNGQPTGDAFIYVADAGGIQGLTMNVSASTIVDNCTPSTCPVVPNVSSEWAVVAQNKFLYVGYPSTGQIYGWTIASDGSLATITGVNPFSAPYMIGNLAGTQAAITNPAGNLLFVLGPSSDFVYVYTIGTDGTLANAGGSPMLVPFEPFNLAIDGMGRYLYVSNVVGGSSTDTIAAYNIGNTGLLSPITGSPFVSPSGTNDFSLMQMQGDSSGKYLVGTTSTFADADSHLYVLSIGTNGAITPAGTPTVTANPPALVAIQPNPGGTLVYSMSTNNLSVGGQVEGYTLNTATGALTAISGSPFGVTGDWGQFDQSGTYLFVRDLFSKDLSVYNVATSPTLTQPVASVGWGPGAWVPTDIP